MKKLILIVEDDEAIGEFIVQVITEETPYQATLLTNGKLALHVLKALKPSLLLLDYRLPAMTGIQLYDLLCEMQALENIPVIIMSAHLPYQELQERQLPGIAKPFELDELFLAIEEHIA
ncbi:MAG: response regulator [Chloroflexota bacterium]|nr:response regulator [Chloroflexota bacterium]